MRSDPKTAHLPVVVISADANPHQISRLTDAGAQGYLTKPLDIPKVLDLLDSPVNSDLLDSPVDLRAASSTRSG